MIRAKNYETVPKFVKVMARILWPFFSRTRCSIYTYKSQPNKINWNFLNDYDMHTSLLNEIQESHAIAKMTARCALYMGVPGYAHDYFSRNC